MLEAQTGNLFNVQKSEQTVEDKLTQENRLHKLEQFTNDTKKAGQEGLEAKGSINKIFLMATIKGICK